MKILKRTALALVIIFVLPTLVSGGLWAVREQPENWRDGDVSSSGLLPAAKDDREAAIYVFSARTGGLKGALASHAWIVTKEKGGAAYVRYDKISVGTPIRRNYLPPDAYWYSNVPQLVTAVHGGEAERLIPEVERAIAAYPYSTEGSYRLYPGPNSNTFLAHVLRSVPGLGAVLPSDAVGRDYLTEGTIFTIDPDRRDFHLTYRGLIGVAAGSRSGIEVHFLGLVAGFDIADPGLKVPGLGTFRF